MLKMKVCVVGGGRWAKLIAKNLCQKYDVNIVSIHNYENINLWIKQGK